MKPLRLLAAVLLGALATGSLFADKTLLRDDFSDPKDPRRRAMRGDWQFANGIASVKQDDELYRKYKDHGPILFYDLAYGDATASFSFRAEEAKTVVFTMNGEDGHVFRFVLSDRGLNVRAFPPDAEAKSISLGAVESPALVSGDWTDVRVSVVGGRATIAIGEDFEQSWEHPSLARPKTNLSVGFSFGSLAVKALEVTN